MALPLVRGILGAAGFTARHGAKMLTTPSGRFMAGSALGGLIGAVGGEGTDESMLAGALTGAAIGGGIGIAGMRMASLGLRGSWRAAKTIVPGTARGAIGLGNFMVQNPRLTMYGALGLGAAYALSSNEVVSPQTMSTERVSRAVGVELPGGMSGMGLQEHESMYARNTRQRFMNSTIGMVQGLHYGRHHGR